MCFKVPGSGRGGWVAMHSNRLILFILLHNKQTKICKCVVLSFYHFLVYPKLCNSADTDCLLSANRQD